MKIKVLVLEHDEGFISECRSFFVKEKDQPAGEAVSSMPTGFVQTFENDNYLFYIVNNLDSAIKTLLQNHFDIIIANLDLAVEPTRNIFSWVQTRQTDIPILVLGHDISKEQAIELIHFHAFALLEKPYSFQVLQSKLEEAMKYTRGGLAPSVEAPPVISETEGKSVEPRREFIPFLGVEMDYDLRMVRSGSTEITLTPSEFTILELLVSSHGRRISREEISQALWGRSVVSKNTLNTHLYNLKNKIPGLNDKLRVIYGSGYVLSPN